MLTYTLFSFSDSPRRRGGGLSGCSGAGRGSLPPNAPPVELQSESHQEAVSESFPVSAAPPPWDSTIDLYRFGVSPLVQFMIPVPVIFPPPPQQMVIENAREKILNDKSLQEKLAENINKILGR